MTVSGFLSPLVLLCALIAISPLGAATVTDNLTYPIGAPGGESPAPDSLDDIWQGKYNAWGIDPAGDEDADGRTNLEESIEGTDPNDPLDKCEFGVPQTTPTEVLFAADVKAGKKYRVLSSDNLADSWAAETLQTPVSGTTEYLPSADQTGVSFSIAITAATKKFYRLETSDADANADGVSDWVSTELGLDPASTDTDGDGVTDAAQLTTELTTQDIVTVTAENAFTTEDGGSPGMLKLRRNHSLLQATTVFNTSGTAIPGTDYTLPASPVNFPRGDREVSLAINPMTDSPTPELEGGESVTVALDSAMAENGAPLLLGTPSDATVIILDPTVPTGTGLLGEYFDTSNGNYANAANFNPAQLKLTRVDPVIDFNWGYGAPINAADADLSNADTYSVQWDGYLEPNTAGDYTFRLLTEGDDQARVLVDLNDGNGLQQILENGWDTVSTDTWNISSAVTFAVPAAPVDRYRMIVEFIEHTGTATCRVQWSINGGNYADIPNARVFRNNTNTSTQWNTDTFEGTDKDFTNNTLVHQEVETEITRFNNGYWLEGSPDPAIHQSNFSVRWSGQVQPQFSEEYTFMVNSDDVSLLSINGEPLTLVCSNTANSDLNLYAYDDLTGIMTVTPRHFPDGSFVVGEIVRMDPRSGPVTGPYANHTVLSVIENAGDYNDQFTVDLGIGAFAAGSGTNMRIERINKPIGWTSSSNTSRDRVARVTLQGGLRYDIVLEYREAGGDCHAQLYWASPSQTKQLIPSERLYPADVPQAPPIPTSESDTFGIVGGPFSFEIDISNGGTPSATGLPPTVVSLVDGVLTGTPTTAGIYQVIITTTGGAVDTTSLINLEILATDGDIEREFWNGVSGVTVADIPLGTPPTGTNLLTSLEAGTDVDDNYGARVRGYITAPVTGNYYFWIAASNAAELWISNDHEPINALKRASVITGSATPQDWNAEANQKSAWLALEAGQQYYVEILHKAGVGPDNLAVGWAMPATSADATAPTDVVPAYVLSHYVPAPPGSTPGTLYVGTMLEQPGVVVPTDGVGSSTLRLSEDETHAFVKFNYANLTGPLTDWHVHIDPFLGQGSSILYDPNELVVPGDGPQPDGSHRWTFTPSGGHSAADQVEALKQGALFINLHTALNPGGEIRGNYHLAAGSRTFTVPPAPPATDLTTTPTAAEAARFLTQATYGPNVADINALIALGNNAYVQWIDDQFTKPATLHLPEVYRTEAANTRGEGAFGESLSFNAWWWASMSGEDQLRQRIAFALSEILVVSAQGPLNNNARAISYYHDELANNAFGNFRTILETVTLTPSMGRYLDMFRNDKPDIATGRIPNENYAREIKQLFSIGLFRLWPDGTLMLTSADAPIDTYSQREIVGLSHVFTGWDYGYDGGYRTNLNAPASWTRPMREVPNRHFTGPKRVLNNEVMPGLPKIGELVIDPYAIHNSQINTRPEYTALPSQELSTVHDQLFNHPNVGPFICRQLIQRLVTSHPSRDYLYRVVQAFNDDGTGTRGNMQAVIKAILLDYEARHPDNLARIDYGKQREPIMRVAGAYRAFRQAPLSGTYTQTETPNANDRYIYVTTDQPHQFVQGDNVFLEFTDTSGEKAPFAGSYQARNPIGTNNFRVIAKDWLVSQEYRIAAGSTICRMLDENHWFPDDAPTDDSDFFGTRKIYLHFYSGPLAGTKGVFDVTSATRGAGTDYIDIELAPVVASDPAERVGDLFYPRFSPGSYNSRGFNDPAYPTKNRIITMDVDFTHDLDVGDEVMINFYGTRPRLPRPKDHVATVHSIIDDNTWTFLAHSTDGTNLQQNQSQQEVYQFPLKSLPMNRSGDFGSRSSTFNMGRTNAGSLNQTPLDAPTVFNYFLPDYKYPGTLASQGITTPEFQTTAETTVVQQANFIEDGVFNPTGNSKGISSFKNGSEALVLNYSDWMGDATDNGLGAGPDDTQAWASNANVGTLIDQFDLLLSAQLSPDAKACIAKFIGGPIDSISVGNPCTVTTASDHGLADGDLIFIRGVSGGSFTPGINSNSYAVTVTGTNSFTIPVDCSNLGGLDLSGSNAGVEAYDDSNPTSGQIRNRIRSILHFLFTSPDFTTQR